MDVGPFLPPPLALSGAVLNPTPSPDPLKQQVKNQPKEIL